MDLRDCDEPGMLVRGVVDHQVHDQLDAAPVHFFQHFLPIGQAAEFGHDVLVVADIVAVVVVGRSVNRRQPDHVDAQLFEVIQFVDDAAQVADAVAVAVEEAARVDLVNDAFFPPLLLHVCSILVSRDIWPQIYTDGR